MLKTLLSPKSWVRAAVILMIAGGLWLGLNHEVYAASFTYPHYNVDITVNQDSTVDVTETLTYHFLGLFHGVIRDITTSNPALSQSCIKSGATCGGFERISLQGVYDGKGNPVDPADYTVGSVSNEDDETAPTYFEIKWTIWPDGQYFDGSQQDFTWKIKYRLYGSLGFFGTDASKLTPYVYWNALPDTRGGDVVHTQINLNLPANVTPDDSEASLNVYTDYNLTYNTNVTGHTIAITADDIGDSGNFTISYKLPVNSIALPAKLNYSGLLPWFGTTLKIDGVDLGDTGGTLNSLPSGKHTLAFDFPGYATKTIEVNPAAGESIHVDSTLTPGPVMAGLLLIDLLANLSGAILIPVAALFVYIRWRHQGHDVNMPATIIPLFSPPKDVHPYLLGSIKDEQVDQEDITGSIIDLAYRGYIKIREIEANKNYELTRLEGKPKDEGLNDFEQELMDAIFNGEDTQETKDMGDYFAVKYATLKTKIYKEMVDRGYFKESPLTTRAKYSGCGVLVLIFGIVLTVVMAIFGTAILGVPGPLLLGVALFVLGVSLLIAAKYMPAKTALGSKVYAEVLGFRMYMYYAERYRVQGLSPEEFEKYLSYAVVFGIEQAWATKFKDIYSGQPDWYEGPGGVNNIFWYSAFTRSFSTSLNSTVYQPLSHGSSSGGGWSGGGSFGGFSGGGGGGGSSGAF